MRTLHFMGTQAASNAALVFLRGKHGEKINFTYRKLTGYEELGGIVDTTMQINRDEDFDDARRRVLYVVQTLYPAFCWELVNEEGKRERGDDGDFTPGENMDVIMAGRLLYDLSVESVALRYELAIERIRPVRMYHGELYTALRIALGQLAALECGLKKPMKAQLIAYSHASARWEGGTEEAYKVRNIVFSALADWIGDWINVHDLDE